MNIDGIEYKLMKSDRRKTIRLRIDEGDVVQVFAPSSAGDEQLREFLVTHRKWVLEQMEKLKTEALKLKFPREYVNGEGFLYWGNVYKLHLVPKQSETLKWSEGFYLRRGLVKTGPDVFKEFYRSELEEVLNQRIPFFCRLLNIEIPTWRTWDIKRNWSSFNSKDGSITFDWRLAMAPKSVVDYLIVHELAHRRYSRHDDRFWGEVAKLIPGYRDAQRYLKEYGYQLNL